MLEANFWQDKNNSQKVVKEKKFFEDLIDSYTSSVEKLNDFEDLNKLASEENNLMLYIFYSLYPKYIRVLFETEIFLQFY